jgi:tripartite-type tricarboxylate transporter receptor subunit TctC
MFNYRLLGPLFAGVVMAAVPAAAEPELTKLGDKISIVIGTPAGGGYDIYGRLVARHLGRFLPGAPSVVASNMPGAGSLIAANWLYNIAPKDGTAIAITQSATLFESLLGNKNAHLDATKLGWLGSLNDYTAVGMVWSTTPFMTAEDIRTREILVGAGGTSSDVTLWPNVLNALVGAKFKLVNGYPGTAAIALAMERGEVQGVVGDDLDSVRAGRPDWITEHKVRFLVQLRTERHPELPDTATGLELAKDEETRGVLRLLIERQKYGRNFIVPPGTKPETLAVLRRAFSEMARDPEFISDAQTSHVTLNYASGTEVEKLVNTIYSYPRSIIDRATKVLRAVDP